MSEDNKNLTIQQMVNKVFILGQRYWSQADSDSLTENKKSEETLYLFNDILATAARIDSTLANTLILLNTRFNNNPNHPINTVDKDG